MKGPYMSKEISVLGIDIGSVAVSIAELDLKRNLLYSDYQFHNGNPYNCLEKILQKMDLTRVVHMAQTSSTPHIIKNSTLFDSNISYIAAVKQLHPKTSSLLIVGGEKFNLINFDQKGRYKNSWANSSCAAGTGSFLDQQAKRLGLENSENLSKAALSSNNDIPKIATRCAVFAKTDLLHAQQEGYTLEAICNGLCNGLAVNIIDTLFKKFDIKEPVVFAGGVALNQAVVNHISLILGVKLIVDKQPQLYGAIGSALLLIDQIETNSQSSAKQTYTSPTISEILITQEEQKKYYYDALELKISDYPDFSSLNKYNFKPQVVESGPTVEVDIYNNLPQEDICNLVMGIDIGSTSTKAILVDQKRNIIAGFYTRTSGRPLKAVQSILEAIDDWSNKDDIKINFIQVGTTGAGRKFIGSVINADLIIDEITAHAKAAYELNPEIDTIIEIGGQDAKFTAMRNGTVTSSFMNHVCAAGTGSFIEEQAARLGCQLSECSSKAYGSSSPMSSDRCTVFMERDINHFLGKGYSISQIQASVLHSVRENYLQKVAHNGKIGSKICFQGATAKNKALVAAFEQKLEKPIYVSKYCHLTGALGVAYLLIEEYCSQSNQNKKSKMSITSNTSSTNLNSQDDTNNTNSKFKGIKLYQQDIPIYNEVCEICTNHCKVRIAKVDNEISAYGFLCGRDYNTRKFVSNNKSGFNLLKSRQKIFTGLPHNKNNKKRNMFTIGIPSALYLVEELPIWKNFFRLLGVKVVTSDNFKEAVSTGKSQSCAEFCAPIVAFHGHISYLADKSDFIFTPIYLEEKNDNGAYRLYCYYSQYANTLVPTINKAGLKDKCLTPLIKNKNNVLNTKLQLLNLLKNALGDDISFKEVSTAYDQAIKAYNQGIQKLKKIFQQETAGSNDFSVMLLGRPYTILMPTMNKGIPDIFGTLGIKAFYMDIVDYDDQDVEDIKDLLKAIHWKFAAQIIKSARIIAETPGVYPVFITSFMCSPDSCTIEYFKRIMDKYDKPYLIMQLDEHDSSVGYETRIESAIRSFRNHFQKKIDHITVKSLPINPRLSKDFNGKTIFLPNWDPICCRLLAANLRSEGIDTQIIPENELIIQKSLQHNTGQCIPLNAIAQGFIDHLESNDYNPEKSVLWTIQANISCNVRLYPYYIKSLLEAYGKGFEKAGVYVGEASFIDISLKTSSNAYFAYMFGGLLRRIACKIRPYENLPGQTNSVLNKSIEILEEAFLGTVPKLDAVRTIVDNFLEIDTNNKPKSKVAIFGDLYVRDNDVMNQNLIQMIEEHQGEVITTPYTEYIKIIAHTYFRHWLREGNYIDVIANTSLLATLKKLERKYAEQFERILGPFSSDEPTISNETIIKRFGMTQNHRGESFDNILKIFHLLELYPDISLFVQTNPSFCCPSLITEAMAKDVEKVTGVPIVSVTYDGTLSTKNDVIIPYLKYPRKTPTIKVKETKPAEKSWKGLFNGLRT